MEDFKLGKSLGKLLKLFFNDIDKKMTTKGYSRTDFYILNYLDKNKDMDVSQRDLCEYTYMKAPTISIALSKLENEKLIVREKAQDDNRKTVVKMTELGQELHKEMKETIGEENNRILDSLSSEERKAFINTIEKLTSVLEAENV